MSNATLFTRIFDILEYQQERYPQKSAACYFSSGRWHCLSTAGLREKADALAHQLLQNGFQKDDKLAIVPHLGHPYWLILDFACQQIGVVVVPIHATATREEVHFILEETEARICITADAGLYHKFSSSQNGCTFFHLEATEPGFLPWLKAKKITPEERLRLDQTRASIKPDDAACILYTSGTSGKPKGAILTHENIVSNILFTMAVFPLDATKRVLSFLPFSHIMERAACYTYITLGASIHFSRDRDSVAQDFKSVRPHFCTAVPRILEKMYHFLLLEKSQRKWLGRQVIGWAIRVGIRKGGTGKVSLQLLLARLLVLNRWRRLLGGKLQCIVVGAAALRPELGKLFEGVGIRVREGYGMTETSPIISINQFKPGMNRFGTVGIPVPGVQLRIDQPSEEGEGEIQVKGPNVMPGYFKRPELNKQSFTEDGWFRTGDIGKIVDGKFLKITDRKKDIFKTSAGKYISPQQLENHFTHSLYISQCLIIGFNRPFVTALIVPEFIILENWCLENGIHWTSPTYMVHNVKVRDKYDREIQRLNQELPSYKRIRQFVLCPGEWTTDARQLTHSLKPIRTEIISQHKKEIDKMYHEMESRIS